MRHMYDLLIFVPAFTPLASQGNNPTPICAKNGLTMCMLAAQAGFTTQQQHCV